MRGTIVVVDDDPGMVETLKISLDRRGFAVTGCTSAEQAIAILGSGAFDAVVTDLRMKGSSGIELCGRIVAGWPDVPVIVITAFGTLETAVQAIRAGAYDFVVKPFEPEQLALALDRAVQLRSLRQEVHRLRDVSAGHSSRPLLGESAALVSVCALIERVADTDLTVLITGETGTGKEVTARALHDRSKRRDGPFIAVNCAALPEQLLESELFGHVKGSFTDARQDRKGLLIAAAGGTLFMDEIGDMPLALQSRLLRALQDRKVRPVGSDSESEFDARIIAATNRDLDELVEAGKFRRDLLYRLDVVRIELPPLRARANDVLLLAQWFIERAAERMGSKVRGITRASAAKLLAYSWPGNVRELENVIERAVALTTFDQITPEDLPAKIRDGEQANLPQVWGVEELVPLEEIERRYMRRVLDAVGGNRSLAAEILCVDRKTLYRRLGRQDSETPEVSS
jgi:DNA-binding NtrC family response regulator